MRNRTITVLLVSAASCSLTQAIESRHSNAKTTGLYDPCDADVSLDEVERIGI